MTQSSNRALDTKYQWQWNSPALSRKNDPFAKSELKMQTWIFPKQALLWTFYIQTLQTVTVYCL